MQMIMLDVLDLNLLLITLTVKHRFSIANNQKMGIVFLMLNQVNLKVLVLKMN